MNETFPLDYGKVGDPDDDIQLRDAIDEARLGHVGHGWQILGAEGRPA